MKNITSEFFRKIARRVAIPLALVIGGYAGFAFADKDDDHLFEISKNMEIFKIITGNINFNNFCFSKSNIFVFLKTRDAN